MTLLPPRFVYISGITSRVVRRGAARHTTNSVGEAGVAGGVAATLFFPTNILMDEGYEFILPFYNTSFGEESPLVSHSLSPQEWLA